MSKQSPFNSFQELLTFCKVFPNPEAFYDWADTFPVSEKTRMWPTLDHWCDCINVITRVDGGSIHRC